MNELKRVPSLACPTRVLLLLALLVSLLLPLQILLFGPPIGSLDPDTFAQLHLRDGFWLRTTLTLIYFPAVIVLLALARPPSLSLLPLFLAGFVLFVLGIGIDLLFRSVQFLVAHGLWAPQFLDLADGAVRESARAKIVLFNEIAPAAGFSFSLLFGVGRILMALALLLETSLWWRLAGVALLLAGLLNLGIALTIAPGLPSPAWLGTSYLWLWPIGLVLIAVAAWTSPSTARRRPIAP